MSAQPISMCKLKDVLRLKYESDFSQRQISVALGLSLGAVNKYLNAALAAELVWPLPDNLSEAELKRKLFPPEAFPPSTACAHPDFAAIHQELKRKGVTRLLLWQEYAEANPGSHYQYTQFCHYHRQWCARLKLSMRQTHRAGEKMFVDYAGQTAPVIDRSTGEIQQAQIFVAVLGASSYTHTEATLSQKLPHWIGSHVRAEEGRKGHTTIAEHMPSHHRAQSEWNPERFLQWAAGIGPQTEQFVRDLLESRSHPELSYRSCLGLLGLARHYTPSVWKQPANARCCWEHNGREAFAPFSNAAWIHNPCRKLNLKRPSRCLFTRTCAARPTINDPFRLDRRPIGALRGLFPQGGKRENQMVKSHAGVFLSLSLANTRGASVENHQAHSTNLATSARTETDRNGRSFRPAT